MQVQTDETVKRVLVTGANGNIGRRLLGELRSSGYAVRAFVRSERAKQHVLGPEGAPIETVVASYTNEQAMVTAMAGCDAVVHLVGIIKESRSNSFHDAHVATSEVLVRAANAAGVGRIVYLSIVGSAVDSTNACLRSKGQAETILCGGQAAGSMLQVPMVLGEGDYASAALRGRASKGLNFVLRAGSLEQPIYVGDVIQAIQSCLALPAEDRTLALAGPESLPRRELIARAAAVLGGHTRVVSLPLFLGQTLAALMERISANPPVTRAMLGVLDHDDAVDPGPACELLGLELTGLDDALRRCFGLE